MWQSTHFAHLHILTMLQFLSKDRAALIRILSWHQHLPFPGRAGQFQRIRKILGLAQECGTRKVIKAIQILGFLSEGQWPYGPTLCPSIDAHMGYITLSEQMAHSAVVLHLKEISEFPHA